MSRLCVCIVSDAQLVADSLAMGVAQHGHDTAVYSSTDALIASGRLSRACAVISNIMDGGASERELARRVFELAPNVPIFFIASTIFTRGALLSAPSTVRGIFDSPCIPEELFRAIDETCICVQESGGAGALTDGA